MAKNERVLQQLKQMDYEFIKQQLSKDYKYLAEHYDAEQSRAEYQKAFKTFLKGGVKTDGLIKHSSFELLQTLKDPKYQGRISIDSTVKEFVGSYLFPVSLSKEIEKRTLDAVAMRRLAKIEIATTGEYKKPISTGGITGAWAAENQERTVTNNPHFAMFAPVLHEVYCNPVITRALLDDSAFDVEAWLISEVSDAISLLEGEAFINGDGKNCPVGLLNPDRIIDNSNADYRKIGYLKSGHATFLNNADSLIDVWTALPAQYRKNAVWLMNDETLQVIKKLKTTEDYIFKDGLSVNSDRLLGHRIEIDHNLPNIGAGTYPIAFGDFKSAYNIIDHISGLRCMIDIYTSHGFIHYYCVKRTGGGVYNPNAVKLLRIAE